MSISLRKLGIIGVGHVGAHVAFSVALQGLVDEIYLVDIKKEKTRSERQDLIDSLSYLQNNINVYDTDHEGLKDCDIIVISVGTITPDNNRSSELYNSANIVESFIEKVVSSGFTGIFISITNPCDVIAHRVWELSNFPKNKVIGTGTGLDSSRLRSVLARETSVDVKSIVAYMLGEHGDSQMIPWSIITCNGASLSNFISDDKMLDKKAILKEVRGAGWITYIGKGATEFGIASTASRLIQSILRDEKAIIPVSTLLSGEYGETDVFAGVPCVIGKDGVEKVIELDLSKEELLEFKASCKVIKKNIALLKTKE